MAKTIYVLNGPNLNLLGSREPKIYGRATLADVEKLCQTTAAQHGLGIVFRQSNHEGQIVDWINEARAEKAVGLIINPAGLHDDLDCNPRCTSRHGGSSHRDSHQQHPCARGVSP